MPDREVLERHPAVFTEEPDLAGVGEEQIFIGADAARAHGIEEIVAVADLDPEVPAEVVGLEADPDLPTVRRQVPLDVAEVVGGPHRLPRRAEVFGELQAERLPVLISEAVVDSVAVREMEVGIGGEPVVDADAAERNISA